jgi:hypothetical protein
MTEIAGRAPIWIRVLLVVVALAGWFATQRLIGERQSHPGAIYDGMHALLEAPHRYLEEHPAASSGLLIVSSAVIDALGIFLLLRSILGPTMRPFLGLLILFAMRQVCQLLCALEPPQGMIWYDPGFPTLLVTYNVATDFFFSGHTGLAVLGAVELARLGTSPAGRRRWLALGIVIAVFEATTVLVLRAHYTMDVFTGAVVARYASMLAPRFSPACDRLLGKLSGRQAGSLSETVGS